MNYDTTTTEAVPDFFAESNAYYAHLETVKHTLTDDVRRLYRTASDDTGGSGICRDLLRIIHNKRGLIDPTDLSRLDIKSRKAALRLLELAATPSELSDNGLSGILTPAQIQNLLSE